MRLLLTILPTFALSFMFYRARLGGYKDVDITISISASYVIGILVGMSIVLFS